MTTPKFTYDHVKGALLLGVALLVGYAGWRVYRVGVGAKEAIGGALSDAGDAIAGGVGAVRDGFKEVSGNLGAAIQGGPRNEDYDPARVQRETIAGLSRQPSGIDSETLAQYADDMNGTPSYGGESEGTMRALPVREPVSIVNLGQ